MSARINHAAEARRLAELADGTYGQIEVRNGDMAVAQQIEAQTLASTAQVHATLALVEQQRIANLIAVSTWNVGALQRGARIGGAPADPEVEYDRIDRIFAEVREALVIR